MSSVEPMSSRSGLCRSAPILGLETPALRPLRGGAYEQTKSQQSLHYINLFTDNCFGTNVTIKGEVQIVEWKSNRRQQNKKLAKKDSAFISLPKVLAEECMKVFAKKCNHAGSPAIVSRADNKLRRKWHQCDLQGMQILYIFHLYLPPRREVQAKFHVERNNSDELFN